MMDNDTTYVFRAFFFDAPSTFLLVRPTILLPRPVSSSRFGAYQSKLLWSFFAKKHGLVPTTLPSISSKTNFLGFFQHHLIRILRADDFHVLQHMPLKQQGVPLWSLNAEITSFAHDCSCMSSRSSPCLHFEDLLALEAFS